MRVIIAGSQGISDYALVAQAMLDSGFTPSVILSGLAPGVDKLGEQWAIRHGVPICGYPALWIVNGRYDRGAGKRRNSMMVRDADALVAVWDGYSGGTADTIRKAKAAGLPVHVVNLSERR